MAFEKFIPQRIATKEPKVTILRERVFWISPTATKFFKDFKRTFLLYDRERRVIGFEPTNEQKHSYSLSRTKARTDITVSGMAFLEYYKIPRDKRRSYEATWNDKKKLVEIDLNKPI